MTATPPCPPTTTTTERYNVTIPIDYKYSVLNWKVKPGSSVREGETVAVASSSSSTTDERQSATTTTTTTTDDKPKTHKRPKLRSRKITTPKTAATTTATASSTTAAQQPSAPRIISSSSSTSSSSPAPTTNNPNALKITAPADGFLHPIPPPYTTTSQHTIIAHIQPCHHPTIYSQLCAVCGLTISTPTNNKTSSHSSSTTTTSSKAIISGGITMTLSSSEAFNEAQSTKQRLLSRKQLSLVLDLDHTLVHATADPRFVLNDRDKKRGDIRTLHLPSTEQQNVATTTLHYIKLRPHLKEFVEMIKNKYEISVYTAGTRGYAHGVTDAICRYLVGMEEDEGDVRALEWKLERLKEKERQEEERRKREEKEEEEEDVKTKKNTEEEEEEPVAKRAKTEKKIATVTKETLAAKEAKADEETKETIETKTEEMDGKAHETAKTESNDTIDLTESPAKKKEINDDDKVIDLTKSPPPQSSPNTNGSTKPPLSRKRPLLRRVTFSLPTTHSSHTLQSHLSHLHSLLSTAQTLHRRLFASRITSRSDLPDLSRDVKSLRRLHPSLSGAEMCVMVDDREDVWSHEGVFCDRRGEPPKNLLLVKAFHWGGFVGLEEVNNRSGGEVGETKDEDVDDQLLSTGRILVRLHERFYDDSSSSKDESRKSSVPDILSLMRQSVLSQPTTKESGGATLVFSGLVPLHRQSLGDDGMGARPAVMRYAMDLGAKVSPDVHRNVTHVVAARDGTDKVVRGRLIPRCHVVTVNWLMECYWTLTRVKEQAYLLESGGNGSNVVNNGEATNNGKKVVGGQSNNGGGNRVKKGLGLLLSEERVESPLVNEAEEEDEEQKGYDEDDDEEEDEDYFAKELEDDMMTDDNN